MTAKIIERPAEPDSAETPKTRCEWLQMFLALCPLSEQPAEQATHLRDGGAAVRLAFRTGWVLQWNWLDTEPPDAAREARELGALQGSLRTGSEE